MLLRIPRSMVVAAAIVLGLLATGRAGAQAMLSLIPAAGQQPVEPGQLVIVRLHMTGLSVPAAGFQAFLEFDPTRIEFVAGSYTAAPFGAAIISPIEADGAEIDLAAGVNVPGGQSPTMNDAVLATLIFEAQVAGCITSLRFRDSFPPTRLTDGFGEAIKPLTLTSLPDEPPDPDLNGDNVVNVFDLLQLLGAWGVCDVSACPPDLNCDELVDVFDLLILLGAWG